MPIQHVLRVLLNPQPENLEYLYALLDENGAVISEGITEVAALPIAGEVVLVVPSGSVTLTKIKLPPGIKFQSSKFEQMLPAAVEDQVLSDLGQIHVVAAPSDSEGFYPVAVVDRTWLHSEVDDFLRLERPVTAIVPEVLFGEVAPGIWTLTLTDSDSILRTEPMVVTYLDHAQQNPPVGLVLRIRQLAEEERPEKLIVISDRTDIETSAWEETLGVSVELLPLLGKPRWMTEPVLPAINLATKEFLPQRKQAIFSWQRFKIPLILLAALAVFGLADLSISFIRDIYQHNRLKADIETTFQTAFPDVPLSPNSDPVSQMQTELTKLRHRVGEQGRNDFLPMLSNLAMALTNQGVTRVQMITFEGGSLSCEIGNIPTEEVDAIVAELMSAGYHAQADVTDTVIKLQITG